MNKFFIKIKWLLCLFFTISFLFSFGCRKKENYKNYVFEYRSKIFCCKDYNNLSAVYGYTYNEITKNKDYILTFKLDEEDIINKTYTLSFSFNETDYKKDFTINPIKNRLTLSFYIKDFDVNDFTVSLIVGSEVKTYSLYNAVPLDTKSLDDVLYMLFNGEQSFMSSYYDENGNFTAKLICRIILRDDYPYYYVGVYKEGRIKAFLLDGKTLSFLAIKDVY